MTTIDNALNTSKAFEPTVQQQERVWKKVTAAIKQNEGRMLLRIPQFRLLAMIMIVFALGMVAYSVNMPKDAVVNYSTTAEYERLDAKLGGDENNKGTLQIAVQGQPSAMKGIISSPKDKEVINFTDRDRAQNIRAYFTFGVTDVEPIFRQVVAVISENGGFVSQSTVSLTDAYIAIKIPTEKFAQFQSKLNGLSVKLLEQDISVDDRQGVIDGITQDISTRTIKIVELESKLKEAKTDKERAAIKMEIESLRSLQKQEEARAAALKSEAAVTTVVIRLQIDNQSLEGQLRTSFSNTGKVLGKWGIAGLNAGLYALFFMVPVGMIWGIITLARKIRAGKRA